MTEETSKVQDEQDNEEAQVAAFRELYRRLLRPRPGESGSETGSAIETEEQA